jgi:hypothetical protein
MRWRVAFTSTLPGRHNAERRSVERSLTKGSSWRRSVKASPAAPSLSEKASSCMSKLIHEHLATEPRIQMWGVVTRGEWTCRCVAKG